MVITLRESGNAAEDSRDKLQSRGSDQSRSSWTNSNETEFGMRGSAGRNSILKKIDDEDFQKEYAARQSDAVISEATAKHSQVIKDSWSTKKRRWIRQCMKEHQEKAEKGYLEKITHLPNGTTHSDRHYHKMPRLRKIVTATWFEFSMTMLIVANCVIIGWQAELRDPKGAVKTVNTVLEHLFTAFFSTELFLRALVYNWTFFFDSENHLDIFLVTLSVLNTWILGPAQVKADFLRKATVLRILRLVRIARSYRRKFKEMWQLLRGLVDSFETLVWTYVMMLCVLYMFGIVATTIFVQMGAFDEDPAADAMVKEYFNDVALSMFTLFQIMTLDSWTGISRPLQKVQFWTNIFFVIFISISVFLLMNLITAVIVDQAFAHGQEDKAEIAAEKEKEREEALKDLREIFKEIDQDGSGFISQGDLQTAWKRPKVRQKFRTMDITKKDLLILWTALDNGGSTPSANGKRSSAFGGSLGYVDDGVSEASHTGELHIDDFTNGMRKLKGEAKAKDILKLYREINVLEEAIRQIDAISEHCMKRMRNIQAKLRSTFSEMDATRRTLRRVSEMAKLAAKSQAFTNKSKEPEPSVHI
jgi:voltage-gated sodium channel